MSQNDTYRAPLVFAFADTQVRVHRPILTNDESAERLDRIKKAVIRLAIEAEKVKHK